MQCESIKLLMHDEVMAMAIVSNPRWLLSAVLKIKMTSQETTQVEVYHTLAR